MKKIILALAFSISVLLSLSVGIEASTLTSVDIYLKYSSMEQALNIEQKAPTSITDAGEERIDTFSGAVSYYVEELNLPGKNGMDLVVGRRFNSAKDISIDGYHQYISVKDYREFPLTWAEKYVFPYYTNSELTGDAIYVAFDTVWNMADAEKNTATISVVSDYVSSAINIKETLGEYHWEFSDGDVEIDFVDDVYIYEDIAGEAVTLYRDTSQHYVTVYTQETSNLSYAINYKMDHSVKINSGWEYDIPSVLYFDGVTYSSYNYYYGMFYDAEMKDSVSFRIECYDDRYVENAYCTYEYRPLSSGNVSEMTRSMYTIEAHFDNDGFINYTITRYDGTKFNFCETELYSVSDRFGNTITYDYDYNDEECYEIVVITDSLGRTVELDRHGITVEGDKIINYTTVFENQNITDPDMSYMDDDTATFTASYKINSNSYKNIVYNHSQRAKTYDIGSEICLSQIRGYAKSVIDSIILPTGAERHYVYSKTAKAGYFASDNWEFDYFCTERYDLLSADATEKQNHQIIDYGDDGNAKQATTTFAQRDGYEIYENYDKEACLLQKKTTCTDADYVLTEEYTYSQLDGTFKPVTKTVEKTTSQGTISYEERYTYNLRTGKLAEIFRDTTKIYSATYSDLYGQLHREYRLQGDKYIGFDNGLNATTISNTYYWSEPLYSSSYETHHSIFYEYDSFGNLTSIDGDGIIKEYTYTYGDYSAETKPEYSLILTETYPEVDNITDSQGVDIPSANVTKTSYYDKWGNLVKEVDGEGNTTTYTYDYLGRNLTITHPDNSTKTYRYNDTTNKVYITDENGTRNMVWFDSLGREYNYYYYNKDINAYSAVYLKRYNASGQLRGYYLYSDREVDSVVRYTYYSDGSLKSEITRDGESTTGPIIAQNTYTSTVPSNNLNAVSVERKKNDTETITITNYTNQYGYKVKDTIDDGNGEVMEQEYITDMMGNVLEEKDFRGFTAHEYTYNYLNLVTQEITYETIYTTKEYEGSRLVTIRNHENYAEKMYEYNTAGQLIKESTPIYRESNPVYRDVINVIEYYYDRNGNLTKTVTTTGDGTTIRTATTKYDNRNRPIAVDDGSGYYTRYEYDNLNNVTRMATGVPSSTEVLDRDIHSVTDYEYCEKGFLVKVTDPMGFTESYTNSSRGNVLTFTDKNGNVTTYTYDGLYRLTEKTVTGTNGEESVSYSYDLLGNLIQMVDENGTTVYAYDRFGNVLSETRGTLSKQYTYDDVGNKTQAVITDGDFSHSTEYAYLTDNRLISVTSDTMQIYNEYNFNSRRLEKTYISGIGSDGDWVQVARTDYYYSNTGYLTQKKNYNELDRTISYYADGNISTIVEGNGDITTYVYDNAGRLSSETVNDNTTTYTYDAHGNRATMTDSTGTVTYTYDKNNRLTSSGNTNYTYDNNGNLLSKTGAETASFSFDLWGRMSGATVGSNTATYAYDGNGIRTSKTVNGVTTSFINDGANVIGEISGNSTVKYTYGAEPIGIDNNGVCGFYVTDEHGNVALIRDSSASVVKEYTYDAFGNEADGADSYYNPMRYCGEYQDAETGLIYLRARYYDPSIGRFISEDPYWKFDNMVYGKRDCMEYDIKQLDIYAVKQSSNLYVYCCNNPIMLTDSSGENISFLLVRGKMLIRKVIEIKALHYSRNDANIDIPQTENDVPKDWVSGVPADCHQFTAKEGTENVKYVSPDGHKEAIFDSKGNLVTAPEDVGTYNFYDPVNDKIKHGIYDVAPWIIWGNSPDDKTTPNQRICSCLSN